ncbi:type II toxin-antitoxin system Phd/YefM family antitoxin [Synoicihabitans lomoniglobus]|uniref:Antitoxin n=1 Tax=Synoicihabitans lomoniglobus TaxID=2909285 RepID=A0AAF0I2S9_9BACT|nr:type II toxin-antitoxin system prevent-host-death family antitoxin [Opitutaceae bacterium LMO-M01]WED65923.1 type II toxin-antitoxin system prevent-host-death family antitoxin [Opitutaceae bacterium LMO-M01]
MSEIINIQTAKTHLSRLVEKVAAGEEVIIAKAGKPMVRVIPYQPARKPRASPGKVKKSRQFRFRPAGG